MNIQTHCDVNGSLCGTPVKTGDGYCVVSLRTTEEMRVDEFGLVHGGFVFGMADYAAMIAINHPNVALGGAEVKFLKPVRVGDTLVAEAKMEKRDGKKMNVFVRIVREGEHIFEGNFICVVPSKHVLA